MNKQRGRPNGTGTGIKKVPLTLMVRTEIVKVIGKPKLRILAGEYLNSIR